jgi:hypothetical protein
MMSRLVYRSCQFWNALFSSRTRIASESLLPQLTPVQLILFRRMQPSEQAHAFHLFKQLLAGGETNPDLLTAALLHDVGKILFPLSIFDRIVIVLGKRFFPRSARAWAEGAPQGLRRPFVVAEQHAGWGAQLASQAGASQQTVELIRQHHEAFATEPDAHADPLLTALQAADDES